MSDIEHKIEHGPARTSFASDFEDDVDAKFENLKKDLGLIKLQYDADMKTLQTKTNNVKDQIHGIRRITAGLNDEVGLIDRAVTILKSNMDKFWLVIIGTSASAFILSLASIIITILK